MDVILNYSALYVALCAAGAILFALLLYYRSRKTHHFPVWLAWLLAIARGIAIFIICILLLEPLTKNTEEIIEKPVIVIAHDNSLSITAHDSIQITGPYLQQYKELINTLSSRYQTDGFLFGSKISKQVVPDFKDTETDMSELFQSIFDRYYNRNVGAIIVAGDGIYTRGQDPLNLAARFPGVPVYTIALGDTTQKTDALIEKVNTNPTAYLKNDFPVEILTKSWQLKGKNTRVRILRSGKEIATQNLSITSDRHFATLRFVLTADKPGLQHYVAEITPVDGEVTTHNNRYDFYIQVISNRQKILVLAHSPHPDIQAMRSVLDQNVNYETKVALASDFNESVDGYSLVILHQLPGKGFPMKNIVNMMVAKNTPYVIVTGGTTDFGQLSALQPGFALQGFNGNFDVTHTLLSNEFSQFTISSETRAVVDNFPPLHVPFGRWSFTPALQPLLLQKLGRIVKAEPLIAVNSSGDKRSVFIAGEGIWRWKIAYPEAFSELFGKLFQYVTSKENKEPFRVYTDTKYNENDNVKFDAEVYNETYELITSPKVKMTIKSEDMKEFQYDFQISGDHYRLDAGKLPPGTYTFSASTDIKGKTYIKTGEFSVRAAIAERTQTVANHALMYNLSVNGGGKMFYPNQLNELTEELLKEPLPGVSYIEENFEPVLDWRWIMFVLAALFGIEWFVRKRMGSL
jgi:hypothetical protein